MLWLQSWHDAPRASSVALAVVSAAAAAPAAATGPSTATAPPAAATAAAGSGFARPGLVDCETTAVVILLVERFDRGLCVALRAHLDEPEALAPACVAVGNHLRALHGAELRKQLFQVGTAHP